MGKYLRIKDFDIGRIQCRGRNGWFDLKDINISIGFHKDCLSINFYSKQIGKYPPIVIEGERKDIRKLITQLFTKIVLKV